MLTRLRMWRLRGRLVVLNVSGIEPSLQGVYKGRRGGHYLLDVPHLVTSQQNPAPLQGFVAVPVDRVIFLQVLS